MSSSPGEPLVSIGIPAYARPRELARAIRSVLDQDINGVEVIVGDDSGDLESVVGGIRDDRVVYVRNEPRLGMAANWNALMDRARGTVLGLLMDDDYLLPGSLAAMTQCFDRDPSVGLVFGDHLFSDGRTTWPRNCRLPGGKPADPVWAIMRHRPVAISASLIRREAWQQVRPLPDLLTADMVMHLRIALAGFSIWYVDRPLMVYAVHPAQQSAASPRFREDQVRAWEMFTFPEERAERLRRRRLARARVSVAAAQLSGGDLPSARAALHEAREFGLLDAGVKAAVMAMLAHSSMLTRAVRRLRRVGRR